MIDTAIRTYLLTQTGVTNIVGSTGVFVERAMQGTSPPYVVVSQSGGNKEQHAGGVSALRRADIEVKCYGATDVGAGTLAEAVSTALAAKQVAMGGETVRACIEINQSRNTETPRQGDQTGFPLVTLLYEVFWQ